MDARDSVFRYDPVRRRPLKTDMDAISKAADMKIPCGLILKVIKEEAPKYKARYPAQKVIPAFAYFLAIAEAQNRKAPLDPAGIRKDKKTLDDEFIAILKTNIELLRGVFTVPQEGRFALNEAASALEGFIMEADRRRAAGGQWVEWLYELVVEQEQDFRRAAREGIESCVDKIIWLRHAADARCRLERRGGEITIWEVTSEAFRFLGIPINWTEKQK